MQADAPDGEEDGARLGESAQRLSLGAEPDVRDAASTALRMSWR